LKTFSQMIAILWNLICIYGVTESRNFNLLEEITSGIQSKQRSFIALIVIDMIENIIMDSLLSNIISFIWFTSNYLVLSTCRLCQGGYHNGLVTSFFFVVVVLLLLLFVNQFQVLSVSWGVRSWSGSCAYSGVAPALRAVLLWAYGLSRVCLLNLWLRYFIVHS
jgi:hypothetical protein